MTECKTGFYGENCKKACSIFCKSSRDCNHVTGHCDEGCIGGWQGALCLQVADKTDDNDCLSRFYGVLAALCVCLIIIAILMSYICIYRWKMREKLRKLKYKEDKDIKVASFNMDITTNEKDEVEKNEYQELGELALPSHYDRL
ncbi:multiple epidermal growth factor-like domains protein 10 [Saccostrea cucullata]|uniref:multiple epidermal growth factor-like domains protein 10 n=1 Tax=Saccostrea cuccullata TaxID=36930 RepID=UPI002ED3AC80